MSTWKFFIANSSDLEIQKDITNEARGKQLTLSYNRSGSLSFNIPLNVSNYENTFTNKKCVMVMKNNQFVWSGPIWTRTVNMSEEKIEISAVGWFEILMYRLTDSPKTFSSATYTEGEIVFNLLNEANNDHPTWLTPGTDTTVTPRSKTIETFSSIGQTILDLSDTEDGFDIFVNPQTRQMNLKEWDEFEDRTNVHFGYNWGSNNISNLTIEQNGGEMRNRFIVTGSSNQAYVYPATSANPPSQSQIENNFCQF